MQSANKISLNALRVFAVVAEHLSIKSAASALSVTPSAISHQIKVLEASLGASLFERRNNSIALNDAGRQLFTDICPGLDRLAQATNAFLRDENEICIKVPVSLATRWLISVLEEFKAEHPRTRIKVETTHHPDVLLSPDTDITIYYLRATAAPDGGTLLFDDVTHPVLSPGLLASSGYRRPSELRHMPAIGKQDGMRDWSDWSEITGAPAPTELAHSFDTDDAAYHSAVAGMGVVLASPILIARELECGTLRPLPGGAAAKLGEYRLALPLRTSPLVRRFARWLTSAVPRPRNPEPR